MSDRIDVVVVGAGMAGLTAAVQLGAAGLRVRVLEAGERVGGKAGIRQIDGVEVDTGPSVLTLPWVFDDVFAAVGRKFGEEVELLKPEPAMHYSFADGAELSLHHDRSESAAAVRRSLGSQAEREFTTYLDRAEAIWQAAAPDFVFAEAPRFARLAKLGPRRWARLARIDGLSTLEQGIARHVSDPHLRDVFRRFATYNGSDVRRAPGTLACIAHVELGLGGFGVRGGLHAVARALEDAARSVGVEFEFGQRVAEIQVVGGRVVGVRTEDGTSVQTPRVVLNADAAGLAAGLFGRACSAGSQRSPASDLSMSGYTGIVRARRRSRPAHSVLFPHDYLAEFTDIFDRHRTPVNPTIYVCALEVAHGRRGWTDDEPLFVMINAPALHSAQPETGDVIRERVLHLLRDRGQIAEQDEMVWWRTPEDLASEFPGSQGAIYGSAFHGPWAAFRRPDNEAAGITGLYLASGSAHPGGGVPLAAQSGKQAAHAILRRERISA